LFVVEQNEPGSLWVAVELRQRLEHDVWRCWLIPHPRTDLDHASLLGAKGPRHSQEKVVLLPL